MTPTEPNRRIVTGILAAILITSAGLRLWNLDRVPSGVWIDEAIEGLQAEALRTGKDLPGTTAIPFPRWPVWCGVEAIATGLGGDTAGAIRLPAVLAGLAGIWLAFIAGRAIAGPVAGLAASAFLAGSFWHLQYSRMALPCVMTVAEGLAMARLLLVPALPGAAGGILLVALCAVATYGYAASLVTPVTAAILLLLRWRTQSPRPSKELRLALGVGLVVVAGLVAWRRPESLSRSVELSESSRGSLGGRILNWAGSMTWSTAPGPGYWTHYPPTSPRLTPLELLLVLAGVWTMLRTHRIAANVKTGLAIWAGVSVLPEWLAGGTPHLIRGLSQLGPLAIIAGIGAAAIASRGRWGAILIIAAFTFNGAMTVRTLARFARDPLVATWYLQPDRDAAEWIRKAAQEAPVALSPAFNYERTPVMRFNLGPAVRDGRIILTAVAPGPTTVVAIFRDPEHGEPVSVLFEARKPLDGMRHFRLRYVHELPERDRRIIRSESVTR